MSSRWYLHNFASPEDVGSFAMITSLALILPVGFQSIVSGYIGPIIFQKENSEPGYARKFLRLFLPVGFLLIGAGFLFVYFCKNWIVTSFSSQEYLPLAWMLPWMVVAYSFYSLSMIGAFEIFAKNKPQKLIVSSCLSGAVALIIGYFMIDKYGVHGAFITFLATYITYAVLTFNVVLRFWRKNDYY